MARVTSKDSQKLTIPEPPGWFVVADQHEWIPYDDPAHPEFAGFAIYVRTGITNLEQRKLNERHAEIVAYAEQWNATPEEERDYSDTPFRREQELAAPYVVAWNAIGYDESGERKKLPSPAEAGPDIFDALDNQHGRLVIWILRVVLSGYLATGKARRSLPKSEPPGDTAEPSPTTEST